MYICRFGEANHPFSRKAMTDSFHQVDAFWLFSAECFMLKCHLTDLVFKCFNKSFLLKLSMRFMEMTWFPRGFPDVLCKVNNLDPRRPRYADDYPGNTFIKPGPVGGHPFRDVYGDMRGYWEQNQRILYDFWDWSRFVDILSFFGIPFPKFHHSPFSGF